MFIFGISGSGKLISGGCKLFAVFDIFVEYLLKLFETVFANSYMKSTSNSKFTKDETFIASTKE